MGKSVERKKDKDFSARINDCGLSTRIAIALSVCAALGVWMSIQFGVVDGWFASKVFCLSAIPCAIALIYAAGAALRSRLESKAAIEEEERFLLEKKGGFASSAFGEGASDIRIAGRQSSAYSKHAPRVIAAVAFSIIAIGLYFFWLGWTVLGVGVGGGNRSAFVALVVSLLFFFFGVFCVGQSRTSSFRWLRPSGIWLVLAALATLAGAASTLLSGWGLPEWDSRLATMFAALLAILGAELAANFVMEFYRPRTAIEERPVFESRLLSLVSEPGGVLRNIADTLDYQFGFQVSGTWVYRFAERSFSPLLLCWLSLFWLATTFDEVDSDSLGVREVFGARSGSPLEPGFHLKWPWPIEVIKKFPVREVREIAVGPELKKDNGSGNGPSIVLWTQSHYAKQGNFLIANKLGSEESADNTPPVSFIAAYVPVQFRIRRGELLKYAYGNANPVETLRFLAEKEVSAYLANADMLDVMSSGRERARKTIKKRIQEAADSNGLGLEIVAVALLDAHPPTGEGLPEAFQDVVGAEERKETMIWESKRHEASTIPAAEAQSTRIVSEAKADRTEKIELAKAEKYRFEKRLEGYRALPEVYLLNMRLDFLERDCRDLRKYVVASAAKKNVVVINLEEKRRLDLLDMGDLKEEPSKGEKTSEGE